MNQPNPKTVLLAAQMRAIREARARGIRVTEAKKK
jgi:hypothetical protein